MRDRWTLRRLERGSGIVEFVVSVVFFAFENRSYIQEDFVKAWLRIFFGSGGRTLEGEGFERLSSLRHVSRRVYGGVVEEVFGSGGCTL